MNILAEIELHPSFHQTHVWSVAASEMYGEVVGKCDSATGTWQLSSYEISCIPKDVISGKFSNNLDQHDGLDGIDVNFSIITDSINREISIWCPEFKLHPEYAALLHWCWHGLYEQSSSCYRVFLEHIYTYFPDWGIPVRRTSNGIRIFGGLGQGDELELKRIFDEISHIRVPEIDMTNCQGMGTLLYPLLRDFYKKLPGSIWRVNTKMKNHLKQAGIPGTSIVLGETID